MIFFLLKFLFIGAFFITLIMAIFRLTFYFKKNDNKNEDDLDF